MAGPWHVPASYLQERWFHSTTDRRCDHNNVVAWQLDGPLRTSAVIAAVHALAERHEVLRTALVDTGDGVLQAVEPPGDVPVWLVDLSDSSAPERDLDKLIVEDAEQPFLLTEAPLWRVGLVRLDKRRHVLVLVVSHAVSDGWSMGVLCRDFTRLLGALVTGRDARLPELAVQFGDYAAWERDQSSPAAEAWWRDRLPARRPALPGRPGWQGRTAFRMDGRVFPEVAVRAGWSALARTYGGSLATAVTAGVLTALSPYVDGAVVLGFMHANRDRPELQPLVGPVFDYLPLRLVVSEQDSVGDLVRRVREEQRTARHHRLPLGAIERVAGGPVFDVAVEFLPHSAVVPVRVAELELTPYPVPELTVRHSGDVSFAATVPLNYIVRETESGLAGVVYGNALAVEPSTMAALGTSFATVLGRVGVT